MHWELTDTKAMLVTVGVLTKNFEHIQETCLKPSILTVNICFPAWGDFIKNNIKLNLYGISIKYINI